MAPSVCVEKSPGSTLAETMREFRAWFDHHRIQPTLFEPAFRNGGIVFEIGFRNEDEAELFRQEFDGITVLEQSNDRSTQC
jgi:hypothetical protein